MNPENLSREALRLFNLSPPELQRQAIALCRQHAEEKAVYLALMRKLDPNGRRRLLFALSRQRWGP